MTIIDQSTGFPPILWGVIKLLNGKQVTLVDIDVKTKSIMVETLDDSDLLTIPLNQTTLKVIK